MSAVFVIFWHSMKRAILSGFIIWMLIGRLPAQTDADWIDQEIRAKVGDLENRRALLAKPGAYSNSDAYDVSFYGLNLRIDVSNEILYGRTIIRGRAVRDNLQQIDLDFYSNMTITVVGGDAIGFSANNNILSLTLQQSLNRTDTFNVSVEYSGTPIGGGLQGFVFKHHCNEPIVSSLSQPYYARTWFPCKDQIADKADSVDINITVPQELTAVSNGKLIKVQENDDSARTFYWQERYPIAVYLISIAVSNYTYWNETYHSRDQSQTMPVEFWVYPEYEAAARPYLGKTGDMLAFFADIWGEYPFINEKYGQVQFSWSGGMEHQTATSLGAFADMLICHELSHSWWGDNVTCINWKHIWLNEGFARYAEALWLERLNGRSGLKDYMTTLNRPSAWRSGSLYVQDTTSASIIFNRIVYDKGAWVLHMLRGLTGDENFYEIFSRYRQRYSGSVASTADFQEVCEEVYGQELDWFFEQWVYGVGQPYYKVSWHHSQDSAGRWNLAVTIDQIQKSATLFRMPLELFVSDGLNDTIFVITDSLEVQTFNLLSEIKPESVSLDPDGWVLKNVEYAGIGTEIETVPDKYLLYQPYPNPFNQTVNIRLDLPYDTRGRLVICDLTGREVATIAEGLFRAGHYKNQWQPQTVASGIYLVRFVDGRTRLQRKIVYLK